MNAKDAQSFFHSLYNQYQGMLRRMAPILHIPEADVSTVIKEVFIAYFNCCSLHWTGRRQKAELARILCRKAGDYRRSHRTGNADSIDSELTDLSLLAELILENHISFNGFSGISGSSDFAESHNSAAYGHLMKSLMALDNDCRKTAILYCLERRTAAEICDMLNVSAITCYRRIHKIKEYLKDNLKR